MNIGEILSFIGIPLGIATGIMLVGIWLRSSNSIRAILPIISISAASVAAFVLQDGWPSIPPSQKWHWLIISILAVSLAAMAFTCLNIKSYMTVAAAFIVAFLMQFPNQDYYLFRILVVALVMITGLSLQKLSLSSWHTYVTSWAILAGYSLLALFSGFAKLAFFTGAISAVCAALFVLELIKPDENKNGVHVLLGTIIIGCALCGFAYDQTDKHSLIWFLPLISLPIASLIAISKKINIRNTVSLLIVHIFVFTAVLWSILSIEQTDSWP